MGSTFQLYIRFPYQSRRVRHYGAPLLPFLDICVGEYFDSLLAELKIRAEESRWRNKSLNSILFGGSSVWIYFPELLGELVRTIEESFELSEKIFVQVRIDPSHVSAANIERTVGLLPNLQLILRSSSEDPRIPEAVYSAHQSSKVFELLSREFGSKFELDHLFGFRGQSKESFSDETKMIAFSGSSRIRLRPFQDRKRRNSDVRVHLRKRQVLQRALECTGYKQSTPDTFLIGGSSLETPRLYSNVLGIGAAARTRHISANGNAFRYVNATSASLHRDRLLSSGRSEFFREELSQIDQYHEWLDIHLRARGRVDIDQIEKKFGLRLEQSHPGVFEVLQDLEYGNIRGPLGFRNFVLNEFGQSNVEQILELLRVRGEEKELVTVSEPKEVQGQRDVLLQMIQSVPSLKLGNKAIEGRPLRLPPGVAVAGSGSSK